MASFPTHFNVGAGVTLLVSGFLSRGTALCVAVDLVCPQEEGVRDPPVLPS